jgi:hypothetical protein
MAGSALDSPSGDQIAATAYALPPLTPQGLSLAIVVVSILLAIITTVVVCLRIWVRTGMSGAFNRVWNTEDYLLALGFVSLASVLLRLPRDLGSVSSANNRAAPILTLGRFCCSRSSLWRWCARRPSTFSALRNPRRRIHHILGGPLLHLFNDSQMRDWLHVHSNRQTESSNTSHIGQYLYNGSHCNTCTGFRLPQLQTFCGYVESCVVSHMSQHDRDITGCARLRVLLTAP